MVSNVESNNAQLLFELVHFVFQAGISVPIRTPRGRDIMAACGQLKSASEKKSKAEILREQAGSTGLVA